MFNKKTTTSKGIVALGVTVLLAGIGIGIYFGVTGADSGTTSSDTEDERKGSIWKNIKDASQAVVVWQDIGKNSWGQVREESIAFLTTVNGETSKIDKWTHPKNVGDNPKDRQQQNKAITGADAQNRCSIMFNNEFYILGYNGFSTEFFFFFYLNHKKNLFERGVQRQQNGKESDNTKQVTRAGQCGLQRIVDESRPVATVCPSCEWPDKHPDVVLDDGTVIGQWAYTRFFEIVPGDWTCASNGESFVVLCFNPSTGYRTCIKASLDNDKKNGI